MKKNYLKNDIKIRYKDTTQPIDVAVGKQTRYWEKSNELIDRLKLAREVKSTALDGKLFHIYIAHINVTDIR